MKRTILYLTICAILVHVYTNPAFAVRYHVNIHNGDDANNGLKWSTAFENLQTAIDAADDGDEIWIAAGIYHPTKKIADVYGTAGHLTTPTSDRHRSFLINRNIQLYGGFQQNPSDATTMNSRNWRINQTVLSGDFNENDGDNFENMDENAYHVVILFDASPSLVLDGFYITGGCANDVANTYYDGNRLYYVAGADGGGIYAYAPVKASSPTLTNISFYGNYAQNAGGAMFNYAYANDASPVMTNVSIVHNKADYRHGGGLYNNGGGEVHARLVNMNVVGNESWLSGGGLYFFSIDECSPTIVNTVVNGNFSGGGNGGGVYMATYNGDAQPAIINSTICGNRVAINPMKDGGGLVVFPVGISKANIFNTVIWGNKGDDIDNLFADGDWGKDNTISSSFIEGLNDLDASNLPGNTDPKFLEPVRGEYAPTMDGDYQLTLESPLINKGANTYISISYDLLGNSRIFNNIVDIGAYESQGTTPVFCETVSNEKLIWSYNGYCYVRVNQSASLYVYTLDGTLVKHVNRLSEGLHQFVIPRGFFIVSLNNGVTEKIVVR